MRSFPLAFVIFGVVMVGRAVAFRSPPFVVSFGSKYNNRLARSGAVAAAAADDDANKKPTTMGFKNPLKTLKQRVAKAGAGRYDETAVRKTIDGYISGNKVVVFSWTRCPFCKKAKQLVKDLLEDPSQYEFVELDKRDDGKGIRYELSQITGRTSVPQIWIGGNFVGGCDDGPGIFTLKSKGELVPMLEAAGCSLKGA